MSTWVIISWVVVVLLTAVNVVFFLKLKQASEQMMKMAFPGAKNMGEAMAQMQAQMGMLQQRAGGRGPQQRGGGGSPFGGGGGGRKAPGGNEAQLKAAMEMLKNMQPPSKGKR